MAILARLALELRPDWRMRWLATWKKVVWVLVVSYALGFLATCLDPYWEDDGVRKLIEWRDRWQWAFLPASLIELVGLTGLTAWLIMRPPRAGS